MGASFKQVIIIHTSLRQLQASLRPFVLASSIEDPELISTALVNSAVNPGFSFTAKLLSDIICP